VGIPPRPRNSTAHLPYLPRASQEAPPPPRAPQPTHLAIESKQLAALAARLADQKKAADIRVLEVGPQIKVADYFVIASGLSRPHVKALYQDLHVNLKRAGETHGRAEGMELGWWVLMDYGDVVVHLMQPEAREYYDLDGLYADAREVDWRAVEIPSPAIPRPVEALE
jgi:ribosome-associated protein